MNLSCLWKIKTETTDFWSDLWGGLFTWNNHRLLTFKVNALDRAAPDGVVICRQGVLTADGTDRL